MKWKVEPIKHNGVNRLSVRFPFSEDLNKRVRQIEGARWSSSLKIWHIPDTEPNRNLLATEQEPARFPSKSLVSLSEDELEKIESFRRWLRCDGLAGQSTCLVQR